MTLFDFPDPVNETSARLVASGVVLQAGLFVVSGSGWWLVTLLVGFIARVLTGPTLSPLGQFVTRVATPLLERRTGRLGRQVPGPPKRFAQGVGVVFTAGASTAWLLGATPLAYVLISLLAVAALLEAAFAVCLGCIAYAALFGCDDCDDISERLRVAFERSQQTVNQPAA